MKNLMISLVQIPNNEGEDYNKPRTKWVSGKLIEFDEGKFTNLYIDHQDEITYSESGEQRVITNAYQIRVEKPVTQEKILNSAIKESYRLFTEKDYNEFQADLLRLTQIDPSSSVIKEYTDFIKWVENGINIAKGITAEEAKRIISEKITAYDTSEAVNSFLLNGIPAWLDKETRVGLMNSITIEKSAGFENTTLWLGTQSFTLPVDTAIAFLFQLELYAKQCYNKTAEHKYNLELLDNPLEILEYNYTEGYPEKLSIVV